jgi:co-chaperonin GroES (HSP10)
MEDQPIQLIPNENRIVVEVPKPQNTTASGLHKPQQALIKEREQLIRNMKEPLKVVASGKGCEDFKVGDYVYIGRAGYELELNDKIYHVLDKYDIVCKVISNKVVKTKIIAQA